MSNVSTSSLGSTEAAAGIGGGAPGGQAGAGAGGDQIKVTLPGDAGPVERWLWRGLLVVLCLLVYVPSLSPEFLWDDERHAAAFGMRDAAGLERIWTTVGLENGGTPQYYPLTHTTYWLEYQVFGRNAIGYRVVNVLVHAGCALMLWELLRRLKVPGAYLAAAVFAVHPMMAESVAWVSERKNTLSLLLGLTAMVMYARFVGLGEGEEGSGVRGQGSVEGGEKSGEPDWNLYVLAVVAFVGAMLSKTMAAAVPVLILLMLWWKGKLSWRQVGLVGPMILVAVGMGLFTAYSEHIHVIRPAAGTGEDTFGGWLVAKFTGQLRSGSEFDLPFGQRALLAGMVPWFYLSKLVWPGTLVFFYPRWDLANAPGWWWVAHAALLAVVVGAVVLAVRGKRWPAVVVAGYLVALFPAMGFFEVYPFRYSFVADHFAYHAGWIVLATICAGIAWAAGKVELARRPGVALGAGAALLVVLSARTWVQAGHFIDKYELFTWVLAENPKSWAAANNLAVEKLRIAQKTDEVRAQAIRDGDEKRVAEALAERQDNLNQAMALLNRTIELKPNHDMAHYSMGIIYQMENRMDDALRELRTSAELRENNPDVRDGPYALTYITMGNILAGKGKLSEAIENYRKAISLERPYIQPKSPGVRLALLRTQMRLYTQRAASRPSTRAGESATQPATMMAGVPTTQEISDIVALAQEVTAMQPKNYEAWMMSGDLMSQLRDYPSAIVAYREALQIRETDDVLVGTGIALGKMGRLSDAAVAFGEAIKKNPNRADAKRMLAETEEMIARLRAAASRPSSGPSTMPATVPSPR